MVNLPIFESLLSVGLDYGTNLLVEFEPDTIWYDVSLAIAADALRKGLRTEYHTLQLGPTEVRKALNRLGLDVKKLEEEGILRIIDSYNVALGIGSPEEPATRNEVFFTKSLRLADWSVGFADQMKSVDEREKRWLHIDDDLTPLLRHNDEKAIIHYWQTRMVPWVRAREALSIGAISPGVASESFYKQLEPLNDGIIDLRSREEGGLIGQYLRVRVIRGMQYDSRWLRVELLKDGDLKLTS